jgi:hypothetical protein
LWDPVKKVFAVTQEEKLARWFSHFKGVLNQEGITGTDLPELLPIQHPIDDSLDLPFVMDELLTAINQVKLNKAPGEDGIPIEVDRFCGGINSNEVKLIQFNAALNSGEVLKDFKDVIITVLFKKGVKTDCDNYRGISLINHWGKVLERLIQNRLLPFALSIKDCIPESQCGFLPGRSTVDALLVSRILASNAIERGIKLFKCFIDLTKAYDRVDRNNLWTILERYGVPVKLLTLIKNLHVGSWAKVKLKSEDGSDIFSEVFELLRGLKQGSVFAPLLFNIFFGAIIKAFRSECLKSEVALGVNFGH